MGKWQMKLLCKGLVISLLCGALLYNTSADAEDPELPPLAKMRDANKNNRIEKVLYRPSRPCKPWAGRSADGLFLCQVHLYYPPFLSRTNQAFQPRHPMAMSRFP